MFVSAFIFMFLFVLLIPQEALCWGPGVHAMISYATSSGDLIPSISRIIEGFPKEFLWGKIMADVVIGKSFYNWRFHPHNWEYVFEIFERAKSDRLRSFMLGYMVHLCEDVVAHNFLVPEMILVKALWGNGFGEKNLIHLRVELIAEGFVQKDVWGKIREINESEESRICSEFLKDNLKRGSFGAKLGGIIFRRTIKMNLIRGLFARRPENDSPYGVSRFIPGYVELAYRFGYNFLRKFERSPCVRSDPTGLEPISVSTCMARVIRRVRKKRGETDVRKFFMALREFQPPIFGKSTPVLDILKIS